MNANRRRGDRVEIARRADAGLDPKAGTGPLYRELEDATAVLLHRAQHAGDIRSDVGRPQVLALIVSSCIAADRQRWDPDLRTSILRIIFDGLRPSGVGEHG